MQVFLLAELFSALLLVAQLGMAGVTGGHDLTELSDSSRGIFFAGGFRQLMGKSGNGQVLLLAERGRDASPTFFVWRTNASASAATPSKLLYAKFLVMDWAQPRRACMILVMGLASSAAFTTPALAMRLSEGKHGNRLFHVLPP